MNGTPKTSRMPRRSSQPQTLQNVQKRCLEAAQLPSVVQKRCLEAAQLPSVRRGIICLVFSDNFLAGWILPLPRTSDTASRACVATLYFHPGARLAEKPTPKGG